MREKTSSLFINSVISTNYVNEKTSSLFINSVISTNYVNEKTSSLFAEIASLRFVGH